MSGNVLIYVLIYGLEEISLKTIFAIETYYQPLETYKPWTYLQGVMSAA